MKCDSIQVEVSWELNDVIPIRQQVIQIFFLFLSILRTLLFPDSHSMREFEEKTKLTLIDLYSWSGNSSLLKHQE